MNRRDVQFKRIEYLKTKRRLEKEFPGILFVYIDETFIHKNLFYEKILYPKTKNIKLKIPIGKGTRFSVIYAGSEEGFVDNSLLILNNKEINSEIFEDWLANQLIPNLPTRSVIVLDNSPTHSKQQNKPPTIKDNRTSIKNWLTKNNIEYNNSETKQQLLIRVKNNTHYKTYSVDDIIKKTGHIPLRLPPYHCQLNVIELIWAQMKDMIKKKNLYKIYNNS